MELPLQLRRPDLYSLIRQAVIDGLEKVREFKASQGHIGRYFRFPKLEYFSSGFPHFTEHFFDSGPFAYYELFGRTEKAGIREDLIPSWNKVREFEEADEFLKGYFGFGQKTSDDPLPQGWDASLIVWYTFGGLARFVDRFIHLHGSCEFDELTFSRIYSEWENYAFSSTLEFSIWVPILFVKFAFDSKFVGPNISIRRMSEEFQLARNKQHGYDSSPHHCVIGAATHSLVLDCWTVENRCAAFFEASLGDLAAFRNAIPRIDDFFAALRAADGIETGYSQLIVKPLNWGYRWEANLPKVKVVSTRAYPDHFENFGWTKDPPVLGEDSLNRISQVYLALNGSRTNQFEIAARRLNAAFLRKDESDSILDITIALEALFGDKAKTEMTHKLALRVAALTMIEPWADGPPSDVFALVKKIYDYRSKVVHGIKKPEEKRVIRTKDNIETPLVSIALKLLRHSILGLAHHLEYLNPLKLDEYLITGGRDSNHPFGANKALIYTENGRSRDIAD